MQILSSFHWTRRFASRFALVSFALVLMASLAACGGGSSSSSSSSSSGPVNLTYWAWISSMAQQVPLFNQTHPNIHVTWQNVGAGPIEYNKLFTAVKANNAPDVAEVEFQTLPQFETTGSLVDVSKYGGDSVKDQFPSWMWNEVVLAGGTYAIPQDGGPMALFYREDIFKKYKFRYPPPGRSTPTTPPNCMPPTRKSTSLTFHPDNQDSSPGISGRIAGSCSPPVGSPGRSPSIVHRPSRWLPTGRI